jgi:hypothetical protein
MSPFRDPEWQLHIPQKEYITIVLTHLYNVSNCRGPLWGRRELWPLARRFPLLKYKVTARRCRSGEGSKPYKTYIVTESEPWARALFHH